MDRAVLAGVTQGPIPSTREDFWGYSTPNKASKPQIETRNTIKQLRFCQFLERQPPPHKTKAPAETQNPPIENVLTTVLPGP